MAIIGMQVALLMLIRGGKPRRAIKLINGWGKRGVREQFFGDWLGK